MAVTKKQPRAYELAKDLGVQSKELIAKLAENGAELKGNFSVLDDATILLARKLFRPLSGGPKAAREIEEKEKERKAHAAAAAAAAAEAKAAKPPKAEAPRTETPAHHAPRTAAKPSAAPKSSAHPRTTTTAKTATTKPASTRVVAPKGPQPATKPMPGLLSKPPPPPPAPPAPPVISEAIETASAPAVAAPAPKTVAAPTPKTAAAPAPKTVAAPAPKAVAVPSVPARAAVPPPAPIPAVSPATSPAPGLLSTPRVAALTSTEPVATPAPVRPSPAARPASPPQGRPQGTVPPRPSSGRPEGRPQRPQGSGPLSARPPVRPVVPPPPPRAVYYGPSPAPADYDPAKPRQMPTRPATLVSGGVPGSGPMIRPTSPTGASPRPSGRSATPPAPGTPGQKTIFRLDEKEEERKRKDREKELAKEAERQRRDAAREAHRKKQENYQARQRAQSEVSQSRSYEAAPPPEPQEQQVRLPESIVVSELANVLSKTPIELVTKLISLGTMASINQRIDFDVASIVCQELGFKAVLAEEDQAAQEAEKPRDPTKLLPRPPVVTVMGHVDHGKTSLLDAIRESKVAEGEHGGITQHIGAYSVRLPDGHMVTFLDTPGHEAFTAMRAHGAKVTDCAVLVVAADDGVMPQTQEAINHAQAAGVPVIVAINKIDKPGANLDRVKQQLSTAGLMPEEWGGKTICVPVSATKRQNLQQLLEMIVLQSEILELKADPTVPARGVIIESRLDRGRGPVATVLIQDGTLKMGDIFVAGSSYGRVRALLDDLGRKVKDAGPGTPVNVMGFDSVAEVATTFTVVDSEATARDLVAKRVARRKIQKTAPTQHVSLEELFAKVKEGAIRELKVIIKADTHGSVTALSDALGKVANEEVTVNVIHGGVGAIHETDVMFAAASDAIIIGFHVRPTPQVTKLATQEKVDIRLYSIIYEAVEEVESAIKGMLAPKFQEVVFGHAEVRQAFSVPKIGRIAGSYVLDGKIVRNGDARVIRDGVEIYSGKIASLRRFKEDAREVLSGFECGIGLEKFSDVKEKDIIEVFKRQEVARD
ncbi:MAG: translation initiation factor IF-2 [Candidatus Wallbacteria bacterium]|nr:translation initiation factor IF-2 [Candidatus Wallbacteria bacterium]